MFVPNTPKESNDYVAAIKAAVAAFAASENTLDYYVVTNDDLKRETPVQSIGNVVKGLNKQLAALKSTHEAIAGKDDGVLVAAIANANYVPADEETTDES